MSLPRRASPPELESSPPVCKPRTALALFTPAHDQDPTLQTLATPQSLSFANRPLFAAGRSLLRCTFQVARWELRRFWLRPMTYGLLLTTTAVAAASFSWLVTLLARGSVPMSRRDDDPVLQFFGPNIFLVGISFLLVPLLTMSAIADERRRGGWELLLTTATRTSGIILGKFLAAWTQWLVCFGPWVVFGAAITLWNGEMCWLPGGIPWFAGRGLDVDAGALCGGVFGIALLGGTFMAWGLFCSSLCRTGLAAAALCSAGMLAMVVAGALPKLLAYWSFPPGLILLCEKFGCWGHLEQFSTGLVSPRIVVAHVSCVIGLLWCTVLTARHQHDA